MKIRILIAMMCLTVVNVFAAEKQKEQRGTESARPQAAPKELARPSIPNPHDQFNQMIATRANTHLQQVTELKDIKKLAEEEKATKTAAAIQAMIDKKEAEYKKSIEDFENIRKQRAEQIEQRLQHRRPMPRQGAAPSETPQPAQPQTQE